LRAFLNYFDFIRGFEISRLKSFRAHPLDRGHHVGLLRCGRFTQRGSPCKIVRQHREDGREERHCFHRVVPILLIRRLHERLALQRTVCLQPVVCFHDLIRIRSCPQHLPHQFVRI
jgi:hypothetical protein